MQCDLAVDAFVAFRCAVLMPGRLDETGGNGIDCDAFWLKFLYQRFGKEVDGSLGHAVYQRGGVCLLPCIGTHEEYSSALCHNRHKFFDHKYRYRQVGIYDLIPFLESVILKFIVSADSRIADQPVYVSCFLFYFSDEIHHIVIGRHVRFQNNKLLLVFRFQAVPEFIGFICIVSVSGKDQIIFC